MVKQPNPYRVFINDRLGGADTVAEKLNKTPGAIRMWAHRKAIPRPVWPDLIDAYKGLKLDELRALESADKAA